MKYSKIVDWLDDYASKYEKGFVVGVSGGIDSAVTSTLCALTGKPTLVVNIGIESDFDNQQLAQKHLGWLADRFKNVSELSIDLTSTYDAFLWDISDTSAHANANTKSRLRMVALYQLATVSNSLVVGTGNKVEDFGVGFFTKYGDGGVDISPIANLYKSQVWEIGRELGIAQEIIDAKPTDGLWGDGRTDEDQLGISYDELEAVMQGEPASDRAYEIYNRLHEQNKHKMIPVPVFKGKI